MMKKTTWFLMILLSGGLRAMEGEPLDIEMIEVTPKASLTEEEVVEEFEGLMKKQAISLEEWLKHLGSEKKIKFLISYIEKNRSSDLAQYKDVLEFSLKNIQEKDEKLRYELTELLQELTSTEDKKLTEKILNLINAGTNINFKFRLGSDGSTTPLHHAVYYNKPDIVKSLLEAGADPNMKNGNGDTPLSLAAIFFQHKLPIIKMLIENGAKSEIRDSLERTPLEIVEFRKKYYKNSLSEEEDLNAIIEYLKNR